MWLWIQVIMIFPDQKTLMVLGFGYKGPQFSRIKKRMIMVLRACCVTIFPDHKKKKAKDASNRIGQFCLLPSFNQTQAI
jgi:hypothetical protein